MKTSNAPSVEPVSRSVASPKRIAVVDDDRDLRETVATALRQDGYEVSVVPNGLRLLSTLKVDKPDLLLLDVMMSWVGGFRLCRALKHNAEFEHIPVLFMSGRTARSDIAAGLACGAVGYLTKPFDIAKLLDEVHKIIGAPDASAVRHVE